MMIIELFIAILCVVIWFYSTDRDGKQPFIATASLFGPTSILCLLLLGLAKKNLVFVELIIPVQLSVMSFTHIIIAASLSPESDSSLDDQESAALILRLNLNILSLVYVLLTLFLTASWLCGFLMRVPSFILFIVS